MAQSDSAPTTVIPVSQAQSEIDEYLYVREQRRRMLPRAALVGVIAGLAAVAFRLTLSMGESLRSNLIIWAHQFRFGWLFPVMLGAFGAVAAVVLVRRVAPEAAGSGIPHLEAVLRRLREMRWRRLLPVKFVGGALAIGSGLALGREGPTVQMGGAIGAGVAELLRSASRERLALIAAGAGAGLSAAFNAPLAGVVFVLEELQRDFRRGVFGAAFVAAVVADILARSASGQAPVFNVPSYPAPPLATMPIFVVLGLVTGVLGVGFNRSLVATLAWYDRLPKPLLLPVIALVGAAAGLIAWYIPTAVGSGHHLTEQTLVGEIALRAIPLWFVLRFVLMLASYGAGAPGGIFAPMLVLGALIGSATGQLAHLAMPTIVDRPEVFAVVGMAAYFAAIVRAPLTGVVLILEMTGNYWQLLPLITACFVAYLTAELLRDLPIYERLLARDLARHGIEPSAGKPIVVELEVNPDAHFDGKTVQELGLPAGCILVRCSLDGQEWLPTAATRLAAHMRITALIERHAEESLTLLRDGCEGRATS